MKCNYSIIRTVEPASEPITLTEAKAHLRVDYTDDDTYITALITAARARVEEYVSRSLISQTYELRLDYFPDYGFYLPRPPTISVTHVKYLDENGTLTTLATDQYVVDIYSDLARILPASDVYWPITIDNQQPSVTTTFVAGYGTIPKPIIHAIKINLSEMYESREPYIIGTTYEPTRAVESLLTPYRIRWRGPEIDNRR